jgi:hypothetical protein
MTYQYPGRRKLLTQEVRGGGQIRHVGGEVRFRKVAAAVTEPGEIEAQNRDTLRCKLPAHMERCKTVLRAREAMGEQCIGARGACRTIQARSEREPAGAGKPNELIGYHGQEIRAACS